MFLQPLDDVLAAALPAKRTLQSVKNMFSGSNKNIADDSSADEETNLLQNEGGESLRRNPSSTSASSRKPHILMRLLLSLFYFCCPWIKGPQVVLPIERYPPDLDNQMRKAFEKLHQYLSLKWIEELDKVQHRREDALNELKNEKEKLVQKEVVRLSGNKKDDSNRGTNDPAMAKRMSVSHEKYTLATARLNVRTELEALKEGIQQRYENDLHDLQSRRYDFIVEKELETLTSVWKKLSGFSFN